MLPDATWRVCRLFVLYIPHVGKSRDTAKFSGMVKGPINVQTRVLGLLCDQRVGHRFVANCSKHLFNVDRVVKYLGR